ncbi:hypothetical protein KKH43_06655 [Patescibacteria group bacterium]|nr:hypothetical protein [Patescibacteria group bacterium]
MPYLPKKDRERLDQFIDPLASAMTQEGRAGELNYTINRLLLAMTGEGRYKDLNELIGALEAAKLEFYRRKAGPYEDKKIEESGDLEGFSA